MNSRETEVDQYAREIWDYMHMNHNLEKADIIIVMGSKALHTVDRGVDLLLQDYAPLIVMSGGFGKITKNEWKEPEAVLFARRAVELGVPQDKILIEDKSTNTGENVKFTRKLLGENGISVNRVILVQKPYMERRAYATFKNFWPDVEVIVTSPQFSFDDYVGSETINFMIGDLQRIDEYPRRGFQIPQEIPGKVRNAYLKLVEMGYTKYLIED